MKRMLFCFSAAVAAGALIISCGTTPGGVSGLSARALSLTESAVFEVLLEKPTEDSTVYEKELDWEKVPYAIRTDKYLPIGTAFAISGTELITAFHVINLGYESPIYDRYYIRDSRGNIYEVDRITGGSNERDYLIFTVKDKTFSDFFQFDRKFRAGDPVYSIGNALGEGIVVRNGLVLGTVPEAESARWNLLKSSADGNPGNSGGPLVRPDGRVVGLVTALRDNILYSVPAEVILEGDRQALPYRIKNNYGHLILANNLSRVFETSIPLPENYRSLRSQLVSAYQKDYDAGMEGLFREAPEYLTGPNNMYILNSTLSSSFPELDFVDKDDDEWTLSGLERKSHNLIDDGRLLNATVSSWNIYKINKPKSVALEKTFDPRYCMDLILQNIRIDRSLGGDKYRILSFGDPSGTGSYTDRLGRTWITTQWLIGFDNKVLLMYILPLPNGPALITTMQESSLKDMYEWDLQRLCDHTWATYTASFDGWNEFIALKAWLPGFLKDINFNWRSGNPAVSFTAGNVSAAVNSGVFDWSGNSELFLAPSPYRENGAIHFGVRKIILNRDSRGKEYVVMYKYLKPDTRLGTNAEENWNDVVQEKFPFDEKPAISAKDNTGSVGLILTPPSKNPELRYTVYLSMENPQSEENLSRRLAALKQGLQIRD